MWCPGAGVAVQPQPLRHHRLFGVDTHHGATDIAVAQRHRQQAALLPAAHAGSRGKSGVAVLRGTGRGPLARCPRHGQPFRLVGVQQPRTGLAAQHGGELPGEVVRVLDTGVGAERPGRRHLMGGVPGEEDSVPAVPFGDPLRGVPRGLPGDLHVDVRCTGRPADVLRAPLVGEVLQRLAPFGLPRRVEHPLLLVVHRQQSTVRRGVGQVAHDETPVAHHVGELPRAEGDAHVVEQVAGSRLTDPQLLPDGAARAVGRDQVVRTDADVLTGLPVLQRGVHP